MLANVQINNFKITGQVGSGSYGLVFHAVDMITDGEFAIKAVMKQSGEQDRALNSTSRGDVKRSAILQTQLYHFFKSFQNKVYLPSIDMDSIRRLSKKELAHAPHYQELAMHLTVNSHSNIVTIHQILESSLATFIVMDYYPNDMFTSIVNARHFAGNGLLIKKVFLQLCSALLHCHRNGVYHCDIKPENILFDANDNVYICDFGLSTTSAELPGNVCVGSSYYMAPERMTNNGAEYSPTESGDIWSLGIILINLVCIRNPWMKADRTRDSTFRYFVQDPRILLQILPLSEDLFSIVCSVLHLDPLRRISLPALMESIANCESFTTEGPLAHVDCLSVEQYTRFLEGDLGYKVRYAVNNYYMEDDYEDREQDLSYYTYDGDIEVDIFADEDDIGNENNSQCFYGSTTPESSLAGWYSRQKLPATFAARLQLINYSTSYTTCL
ncbi:HDL151Cp [Eremothecium sinecaudum]|uniref:non-specific serine/threonine protein kinase n=1 Tax=Eremothecium sinecaudum TaxID=45286 RepID=A0A109UYZ4_9SACH|nr:HDL151Cp [Eremothecium sinecaudum]AMD20593.1 HDL151Cp [Eremothecium sinecaudum]